LKITLPKIYPITDRELSGLSHAEQVEQFAAAGATLIQIRDKKASSRELLEDVSRSVEIAHRHGVILIVNDRVDIAMMTVADGVHLGQDDLPPAAARQLLGDKAIIGFSTHSLEQVGKAMAEGIADYIAFGPIFATLTKSDHDPIVGLQQLAEIREHIGDLPLVAIGGIGLDNIAGVIEAGANSAAMISEFYQQNESINNRFRTLTAAAETTNNVAKR
jgi:thiamine-phosphate pyrophosphorylase